MVAVRRSSIMTQSLRIDGIQLEQDDVAMYRRLIRDVCFLYHELSAYRRIIGDLDYANDYPLEYWTLLNRIDTGRSEDRFIRGGILVLFLAMLADVFDGSGESVSHQVQAISKELEQFIHYELQSWKSWLDSHVELVAATGLPATAVEMEGAWWYFIDRTYTQAGYLGTDIWFDADTMTDEQHRECMTLIEHSSHASRIRG